jgi:eukaryotic-like serine/threonine-protein kinase
MSSACGTMHPPIRRPLGTLLAIALGIALTSCGSGESTTSAGIPSKCPTVTGSTTAKPSRARIAVPPIFGQRPKQAAIALCRVGLRLGTTSYAYANVEADVVIESAPSPGTLVNPNSPINVTVSSGGACHPLFTRTVPFVAGDSLPQAEAALSHAGIAIERIIRQHSRSVGQGMVISSSPAGGAKVKILGAVVDLTISSGSSSSPDTGNSSPPP